MVQPLTVCIIVNKHGGSLRPSETFLRDHIRKLPARTLPLIGNPCQRRTGDGSGDYLHRQGLVPRALRSLLRRAGLDTLQAQDNRVLARYLRAQRVDVVLAEYGLTAVSVLPACLRAGVPLVAHFHGWDAYALPRDPQVLEAYQAVFREARFIIGVSRDMVNRLVALGAPAGKVVHNLYGTVLHETFAHPAEAPPQFVAVGRLTPKKAPFVTLLAFARVREQLPEAHLEMIGDGPLRAACEQLVKALRLEASVRLHGVATHQQVFALLRSGRCFVQHSVTAPDGDSEGTPVAILEAMAMGLPVVATRHGGIPDVVEQGRTGELVDEYDVEGMAEAMLAFARDPVRAGQVGQAARAAAREHWTSDQSLARLAEILERAVATPA